MKRTTPIVLLAVATTTVLALLSTNAMATPGKSGSCTGCHSGPNVPVTATLASTVVTNATYDFSAPGADAVAVFDAATKVTVIQASSGQFTVTTGKTYLVYAVKGPGTSDGIGSTTVSPVAEPVDATAPTTTSDVQAAYVGSAAIHLVATDDVAGSGVAHTYYTLDGGAQTEGLTINVMTLGSHTLEFWSVDVAGNVENANTATFSITAPLVPDETAPTTTSDAQATYVGSATIHLTATDNAGGWGVAHTYYILDGGPQTEGLAVGVSALGTHTLQFWSVDLVDNAETPVDVTFEITAPPVDAGMSYVAVAGSTRYETAVQASKQAFPSGAPRVVIATGANWPDALGGGSLAAAMGGPILLTETDNLPESVRAEIARLGASEAYVLGGTGAVSAQVEAALRDLLGGGNVIRIGGVNRYETAELIAKATVARLAATGGYDGTAFVATGANFPDALAASPLSAAKGWPLFLVETDALSPSTRTALVSSGVKKVLVLGGAGAVSTSVEGSLRSLLGATQVARLAGSDRFATAVAVASYGIAKAGLTWDGLAIATGDNFPDALAGGVMQGKAGSVLLLSPQSALHAATGAALAAQKNDIASLTYLGGTGALSQTVRNQVSAILQ